MKKLLLILTTALIFPSSAWTKNGNYMGLSWGEKCSAVADRFEGTGEGLIFKSNEKFRFRLWGIWARVKIGCIDSHIFSSGRLCGVRIWPHDEDTASIKLCQKLIQYNDRNFGSHEVRPSLKHLISYEWEDNTTTISLSCHKKNDNMYWQYVRSKAMGCPLYD